MKPISPKIPTIAITGSAGKSTTREFVYSILKRKWKRILSTKHNRNLPSHTKNYAKKINASHKAVVLEMGLGRAPGKRHFRYIKPNISVITNIGTAHYGKLGNSIQSIAKSKSALIKYMQPKGTLLINKDDKNSKLLQTRNFKGKKITVGIQNIADYRATNIKYRNNGMSFEVKLNRKRENFFIPAFGDHNVINALFAIAIAHRLNFSPKDIRSGLKKCKLPSRRLQVIPLTNQSLLIDDSFNANPQSVKAAVDVLVKLGKKKKIIVLGSMLELGKHSSKGHEEVGRYLAKNNVDTIYTYGKKAKKIGKAAIKHGFPSAKVHSFTERSKLHKKLKKICKSNMTILVKGSHRMKMKVTSEFVAVHYLRFSPKWPSIKARLKNSEPGSRRGASNPLK
ncbi:UDP-N-acetylmuramoyl-tripeptide--D-alanyl-D-alanine ligase [Melghirimyces profundicolus]|uniref:UDP-N-acetylmuramoyl-tripeptide--D-alanyl-D-alanine ligase n=1 Tax=Melghirimyces profundicolus TaxID=1242148 RepID=A0A2T6C0K5_9BACL|nr:UDP-N-acetylmuramoyl-tripeptide--D-alanyl-D-alanine ligase [Melghirimyces profundicolus]PTX61864.1 UDP-N-acetylmuramoyl-tripeptide--D-alanyl-D-alanine ligase [Melghirimyces profundicolus]